MKYLYFFILASIILIPASGFPRVRGYQYIHPEPFSSRVNRETTLLLRFEDLPPREIDNLESFISVRGDVSGAISGETQIASDLRTVIYTPRHPFVVGETIHVTLSPRDNVNASQSLYPYSYFFTIKPNRHPASFSKMPDEETSFAPRAKPIVVGEAKIMPNGVSVPSDFPHIDVKINKNTAGGFIYINNRGAGTPYNIVFANDGSPVWYLRTTDRRRDFKVQPNGTITMLARDGGHRFLSFDRNFDFLDTFRAVDGYSTDEHECDVTEDGYYYLIGRREDRVDMSQYVAGGQKNVTVRETAVQGFTPDHEKIFEWRAWDHFEDILPELELADLRSNYIRFPHMNAIAFDADGNILLSSKHFSEITKINKNTGEMIWRLGGPKNQFTFLNDDFNGFKSQHSINVTGPNRYMVFDNGTARGNNVSRSVEYELDIEKKTATLIWEYRNPPGTIYSNYMGNCQRLPNGNTYINWAVRERPKGTEVTPAGEVVYEMNWERSDECYRAFRFPWNGIVQQPYLLGESYRDHIKLIFNKFGDTNVEAYVIYIGTTMNDLAPMDTTTQTLAKLSKFDNNGRYFFGVRAMDSTGALSDLSNVIPLEVQFRIPGANMVYNGDFHSGKTKWIFQFDSDAAGKGYVTGDQEFRVFLLQPGSRPEHAQLKQAGLRLVNGRTFHFEFDAYADDVRTIDAKVERKSPPYTNYGKIGATALSTRKKRYSYMFTMEEKSDFNAQIVFNFGGEIPGVFIDNVSLREVVNTAVAKKDQLTPEFKLLSNYPNPFNPLTIISYELPEPSRVTIKIYNLRGQVIDQLARDHQRSGLYSIPWDASEFGSGIYFYKLIANAKRSDVTYQATRKMMVIR